ncbi:zinc finger, CCHC-type, retrotransposon gag domain protein [Tanacetum coccineum]
MVNTRTDAELAAAVQAAVDAMLPQIREQVREEYRTGAVASGSNPPPVTIHTWLERFNKQKPRSFEKAVAPVDAENWISHMEKIFDVMDCNDAFKTRLAVYKFEGDALAWWKAYKQAKGGDAWVLTLTWAAFKELFFLQFFPRADKERLKREYHSIRQRASENSTEYMQRFLRLGWFFFGQACGMQQAQCEELSLGSESSDKRHKSGDRYQSATQELLQVYTIRKMTVRDLTGRAVVNSGTGTRPKEQSVPSSPGYLLMVILTLFSKQCGRRHPGRRVSSCCGTCFKLARLVIFSRDCKEDTGASSSGHADKKPERSGCLCITQDQAANTSCACFQISGVFPDELLAYTSIRDVEVEGSVTHELVGGGFITRRVVSPWGLARFLFVKKKDRSHCFSRRTLLTMDPAEIEAITKWQRRRSVTPESETVCMDEEEKRALKRLSTRLVSALYFTLHLAWESDCLSLRHLKPYEGNILLMIWMLAAALVGVIEGLCTHSVPTGSRQLRSDDGEIWAIIQNIDQQTEFRRWTDDGISMAVVLKVWLPEDLHFESMMTGGQRSPFSIHPGTPSRSCAIEITFNVRFWKGLQKVGEPASRSRRQGKLRKLRCQRVSPTGIAERLEFHRM